MRRRHFIALLGGAAVVWPLAARGQQAALPVIGFLDLRSADYVAERLRAFHQGLKETGYIEGENVAIVYRFAENQTNRLPELAADLVRRQVAVIATAGDNVPSVVKAATTTIPIVFIIAQDPVRMGLVASIARPGANLTGINFFATELVAKRLELLRELVPTAAHIAVLINPANVASAEPSVRDVEAAARAMRLQIQFHNASTREEIESAFAAFARERPDALFVGGDPFFSSRARPVGQLGGASCHSDELFEPGSDRNWRVDELRRQHFRCVASIRHLCWLHPQGRETRRSSGRAVDQVRTRHQHLDRQDARPHRA